MLISHYRGAKGDKKGAARDMNSTFDDWLARKQNVERDKMKGKKKSDARQKMINEDKKRANAGKDPGKQPKGGRYGLNPKSPEVGAAEDGSFDMMKLRKEMNIFKPIEIKN